MLQEWQKIHRIADGFEPKITAQYVELFRAWQKSAATELLQPLDSVLLYSAQIKWIPSDAWLMRHYSLTAQMVDKAMQVTTSPITKIDIASFNVRNPDAVQWAINNVGLNIKSITNESRKAIQRIIRDALLKGGGPKEIAKLIERYIGLTDRQVQSVLNYQTKLDETGRSATRVNSMVDTYVAKLIRARALTISRTETISAACGGQQLHWEDMIKQGLLGNDTMQKIWITTPDDHLCPYCRMMSGQRTTIEGMFNFGGKHPPVHPACRCAIGLVPIEGSVDNAVPNNGIIT